MAADCSYWSDLLPDLLALVFSRLELVDFISAAATCRSWRKLKSRSKDFYVRPKSQIPWLMLSSSSPLQTQFRHFHRLLSSSDPHEIRVPEIAGLFCIGSSEGFLIYPEQATAHLRAVNPVNGAHIHLPPTSTIPDIDPFTRQEFRFGKAILSPDPGFGGGPRIVVVTYSSGSLAFARPGDGKWTLLADPLYYVSDILFHKNRLHAVSFHGELTAFDLSNPSAPHSLLCNRIPDLKVHIECYLVESPNGQDLYYVTRSIDYDGDEDDHLTLSFLVFKLHELEKQWIEVNTLGDLALFLGYNQSLALSAAEHPSIKKNSIYLMDDTKERDFDQPGDARHMDGWDMGVYDLEDRSFKRFSLSDDLRCLSWLPPMWFTPALS